MFLWSCNQIATPPLILERAVVAGSAIQRSGLRRAVEGHALVGRGASVSVVLAWRQSRDANHRQLVHQEARCTCDSPFASQTKGTERIFNQQFAICQRRKIVPGLLRMFNLDLKSRHVTMTARQSSSLFQTTPPPPHPRSCARPLEETHACCTRSTQYRG